jgi:hypothetical protein
MAEILRMHPEVQAQEKTETLSCVFIHPQTVSTPKSSYSGIDTRKLLNTISAILSERSGKVNNAFGFFWTYAETGT